MSTFKAAMRPSTIREDGSLCVFRAGVIDTETNEIVYVANRQDCRNWAKKLNDQGEDGESARSVSTTYGNRYPLHATYATEDEMYAAIREFDAKKASV